MHFDLQVFRKAEINLAKNGQTFVIVAFCTPYNSFYH